MYVIVHEWNYKILVFNKIFIRSLDSQKINIKFKPVYKFCNILIPGLAEQKICWPGQAGNFGPFDISNVNCTSEPVQYNKMLIEESFLFWLTKVYVQFFPIEMVALQDIVYLEEAF